MISGEGEVAARGSAEREETPAGKGSAGCPSKQDQGQSNSNINPHPFVNNISA